MKPILKKIQEELKKDAPRIDYVMGMLEVLLAEPETTSVPSGTSAPLQYYTTSASIIKSDEETPIPDFAKPGPIAKLQ